MPLYRVRWEIDIGAATPTDAAKYALEVQRNDDPANSATVFEVRQFEKDAWVTIDLKDDPDPDFDPGDMDGDHASALESVWGPDDER